MTQTAVALAREDGSWTAHELDLGAADDLDAFVDLLRDIGADIVIGFVEEDDEYLGVVRLDAGVEEPRVFLSDRRVLDFSTLAERLFGDALPVTPPDDPDDETTVVPAADPVGDPALLTDLGTAADVLIELISEEGMLPGDVAAAISERAGCAEVLDEVRA